MADIPPPTSLYPAPPQQSGNVLADPARAIGMLNGINQLRLFNAQYPALAETPAANLQSIKQQQQMQARQTIGAAYSNAVAGLGPNATADDVRNIGVNLSRSYPDIATTYPDMIPAAKDTILNEPRGIHSGANILRNSVLSPGEGTNRIDVIDPKTGKHYSVPATSANMGGSLPTSLGAGEAESASARQADLKKEGDTYPNEVNNLRQALHYAQSLPPGSFGPNAAGWNDFKARMVELGVLPQKDAENLSNFQQFQKYAARSISDRANSIGPHTNDGLAAATSGTPNAHMTDLAIVPLLKAQLALRHMEHAAVINPSRAPVGEYLNEKAKFGTNQDPRAYAIETMTPNEIRNLDKSLKPSERATFNKSYQSAISAGILKAPQ